MLLFIVAHKVCNFWCFDLVCDVVVCVTHKVRDCFVF